MKRQSIYDLVHAHYSKDKRKWAKALREIIRDLRDTGEVRLSKAIQDIYKKNCFVVLSEEIETECVEPGCEEWAFHPNVDQCGDHFYGRKDEK